MKVYCIRHAKVHYINNRYSAVTREHPMLTDVFIILLKERPYAKLCNQIASARLTECCVVQRHLAQTCIVTVAWSCVTMSPSN